MLNPIPKFTAFACAVIMTLVSVPSEAQTFRNGGVAPRYVRGQFGRRFTAPYPVERNFLWNNVPQTKSFTGNLHAIVILAEFSNVPYTHTQDEFKEMLISQENSAVKYFKDQLGTSVDITVAGPVKVGKERHYYGENHASTGKDLHPGEFIADVCAKAHEEKLVDFSKFDDDGDGFVDNVYVFYAGEDESQQSVDKTGALENPDFIWAHSWTLKSSDYGEYLEMDGKKINSYACSSELYRIYNSSGTYTSGMATIGVFCHEHSHIFGLADIYDTDYELSGGTAAGAWGSTALMDSGNYNANGCTPPNYNAIDREIICSATNGLPIPEAEELKAGKYTLHPLGTENARTYKLSNPNDSKEYYLFECRAQKGWDKHIGGKGMLVYHIDKSEKNLTESEVSAKKISSAERWSPYNQVNCRPDHQCADLIEADGRVDKDPSGSSKDDISGIFFPHEGATSIGSRNSRIQLSFWDGTRASLSINDITLDGDNVTFTVRDETNPLPPDPTEEPKNTDMLYIVIVDDGAALDMKVSNAVGSSTVQWFFNGREIADPHTFIPEGNGVIRAEISWSDSSTDYLFKKWSGRK